VAPQNFHSSTAISPGIHHPQSQAVSGLAGSMLKHSLDYRRAGNDTQVHA
jgi:hypothetical protein